MPFILTVFDTSKIASAAFAVTRVASMTSPPAIRALVVVVVVVVVVSKSLPFFVLSFLLSRVARSRKSRSAFEDRHASPQHRRKDTDDMSRPPRCWAAKFLFGYIYISFVTTSMLSFFSFFMKTTFEERSWWPHTQKKRETQKRRQKKREEEEKNLLPLLFLPFVN